MIKYLSIGRDLLIVLGKHHGLDPTSSKDHEVLSKECIPNVRAGDDHIIRIEGMAPTLAGMRVPTIASLHLALVARQSIMPFKIQRHRLKTASESVLH